MRGFVPPDPQTDVSSIQYSVFSIPLCTHPDVKQTGTGCRKVVWR